MILITTPIGIMAVQTIKLKNMAIEFETQVLEINKEDIINKLRALGAKEDPEVFQKRFVFDIKCLGATDPGIGEWVRLREVNGQAELTYKNRSNFSIDGTEELEVKVSDFQQAYKILKAINFTEDIYYQENKRQKFYFQDLEFCLDTWPLIPCFLEIEGKSKEAVEEGLAILGLQGEDIGHSGIFKIYNKYGIDLHKYKELRF